MIDFCCSIHPDDNDIAEVMSVPDNDIAERSFQFLK